MNIADFFIGVFTGAAITMFCFGVFDIDQIGREQILNEEYECVEIVDTWHCEEK